MAPLVLSSCAALCLTGVFVVALNIVVVNGDSSRLFVVRRSTVTGDLFSVASVPADPSETFRFSTLRTAPSGLTISSVGTVTKLGIAWNDTVDAVVFAVDRTTQGVGEWSKI